MAGAQRDLFGVGLAGEFGGPIFQDLNGPQLETDIIYRVGWQFSF